MLALGMLLASSCGGPGSSSWAADRKDGEAALKVEVVHLRPTRLERHYRTSGTLTALRAAELVAKQPSIIEALLVEEGETVVEGQILARLDARNFALQAEQAGVALSNLEAELKRLESIDRNAVSREEIDKQRHLVEEARAAAKLSRHQVKETVVRAPFAGTITARHVDVGNLATTATPLFSLADTSALDLELHLPERDAATVRTNTDVAIELVDGSSFTAQVVRRAPVVDALTGTVKLTARAKEFPAAAVPGAFVRARVLVDARDKAPSVPRTAVVEVEGEPHVYVVEEGRARRKKVKLGLDGGDAVEITDGITATDAVIADGRAGITEGMPAEAIEQPASVAAAPAAGT
jgi:membrane fusion protein (multidrug efflux system)